jgi:cytidylate kinase
VSECKNIITIGREYGAGGRSIAKKISETLGIPYYDKDIIKLTAEKTGFTEEMIHDTEEKDTARTIFNWFMPSATASGYDQAIIAQAQTIRHIARQGPCIIVGRGADYILRDFPNVVNVFVYADEEDKILYSMGANDESHDQAARRVRHVDAARESYYHYLTKGKWGNLKNYDITLNSSNVGKEACAEIIMAYASKKTV